MRSVWLNRLDRERMTVEIKINESIRHNESMTRIDWHLKE